MVALKGRFKNLRRGIPTTKRQLENDDGAVPNKAKRQKLYIRLDNAPTHDATVVDDEAYQHHMKKLEQELAKTRKHNGAIKSLMQNAYRHRQWIISPSPPVSEILTFPALKFSAQIKVPLFKCSSIIKEPRFC